MLYQVNYEIAEGSEIDFKVMLVEGEDTENVRKYSEHIIEENYPDAVLISLEVVEPEN